ncbi:ABC transporter permease [Allofustis seminis]|uniref:ABC transporter permease n=1 Tax=Allofustis seminis TaxID=166939 RepID=UPI00037917D4|nr:ABC transporter permease [Allofustis seminis]
MKKWQKTLVVTAVIIMLWQIVCASGRYSTFLLPTPQMVCQSFIDATKSGQLPRHILASLSRVFVGYLLAFICAMGLAILLFIRPAWAQWCDGFNQFMRAVPPLSLIPLLIIWAGIGELPKIMVIFLATFFAMYMNFEKGLKGVDKQLIEVGRSFKMSPYEIFKFIIIPASLPDILVGMRIGMGYSYRAIIGAELVAASSGLGYMINIAKSMSHTDVVIMGIICIGILGLLFDAAFKYVIKTILKGRAVGD